MAAASYRRRFFWIFAIVLLLGPRDQAHAATRVILIRAGHLFNSKDGGFATDQGILVRGNKIENVGKYVDLRKVAPKNVKLIDLSAKWVLPGFIDCHTHLLSTIKHAEGGKDSLAAFVSTTPKAERIMLGEAMGLEDLKAGITTVRDVGNSDTNGDVDLRNKINAGGAIGPRMVVSTRAISGAGGQFWREAGLSEKEVAREYAVVHDPEEAAKAVISAKRAGADVIKIIIDGTEALTEQEVTEIVNVAHGNGLKVAAHAISDKAVKIAANAGVDSVEHGYFATHATLELLRNKRIYLVPTDGPLELSLEILHPPFMDRFDPNDEIPVRKFEARKQQRLHEAITLGVPIAAGSDDYIEYRGRTRGQASLTWVEAYRDAGMTPVNIILSMTKSAADLLGWSDKVGSVELRKFADIVAVPNDPLKDVTNLENVEFVMKGGVVIKNDSVSRLSAAK